MGQVWVRAVYGPDVGLQERDGEGAGRLGEEDAEYVQLKGRYSPHHPEGCSLRGPADGLRNPQRLLPEAISNMSTKGGVLTHSLCVLPLTGEAQIISPQGEKKSINLKMCKTPLDWSILSVKRR